ncbi:YgaP family membrane protein [Neolewinella sp.]|uniref:YgaP family membrane protein n=1 Tax=Neolewinella sp. TaxID=2993543 RepID=UPI003B52D9EB
MNRFIKGLSYTFGRNLGTTDRIVRAVIAVAVLVSWYFGAISGIVGTVLGIVALMILGTAAVARCSMCYWADVSTVTEREAAAYEASGTRYEKGRA